MDERLLFQSPVFDPVALFLASLILAVLATKVCKALALRAGFRAEPNPLIPQHIEPVAYLGGVGVAVPIFAGTAILIASNSWVPARDLVAMQLGVFVFLGLGTADDILEFSPSIKLLLQVLCSGLMVSLGFIADWTGQASVDFALSVIWIVGIVNAVNFTDVSDGLVGGLTVVCLSGLWFLMPGDQNIILISAGACLGFLWLNWPPAQIYLGDAGTHLIGSLLALLGLRFIESGDPWFRASAVLLLLGVFVFEAVFISAARIAKGLPWWKGSPDHFSLRLQNSGYSRSQVNGIALFCGAMLAIGVIGLVGSSASWATAIYGSVFGMAIFAWRRLWVMSPPST